MNAPVNVRGSPPEVDEGDPHAFAAQLRRELRPTPGRLGDSMRTVVVVLIVVALAETLRVPDVSMAAIVAMVLSGREAVATVQASLITGIVVTLAILAAIVFSMLTLSEPSLRILLMAVTAFGTMWLARVTSLGGLFVVIGVVIIDGLTLADQLPGLALQRAPGGNAAQLQLPEFTYMSPEEALLQTLLWLCLAIALPVAMVIVVSLLIGRDPEQILRRELADRLDVEARFCEGESGAEGELEAQAFEGTARLRKLQRHAGLTRPRPGHTVVSASLIDDVSQLGSLLLAWSRVAGSDRDPLLPAAHVCRAAEHRLRVDDASTIEAAAINATGAARPLAEWISGTLRAIGNALTSTGTIRPEEAKAARSPRHLLATDAFSNPEHVRFALKVSLAVMICYLIQSLAAWPAIGTSIITCMLIALGTVGETLHKAALRIIGCLIGAALGLGTIVLLMPWMSHIGELLLVLAPVTLLAAWVNYGTPRIAYAGVQIGVAFYLVVLNGVGPTVDLNTAKDRVIGILLGNLVIFAIFTTIWPVSVAGVVRTRVGEALDQLGVLVSLGARTNGEGWLAARSAANRALGSAIAQARTVLINEPFEPVKTSTDARRAAARRPIDATIVEQLGRLSIPVSVILNLRTDPSEHNFPDATRQVICAHHRALGGWFGQAASWVRSGEGAGEVLYGLPKPPPLVGAGEELTTLATWYRILHEDIRALLDEAGPQPQPVTAPPPGDGLHAAR
jgi:multidrug resistance protein MdtO